MDIILSRIFEPITGILFAKIYESKILSNKKKLLSGYLDFSSTKYNTVKTIFNSAEPVTLESLYVDLDIQIKGVIHNGKSEKIIDYTRSLVLSSIAGSGKSTLLKNIFLRTIKADKYSPFFIELRYIRDKEKPFIENVLSVLNDNKLNLSLKIFIILIKHGKCIFFLDGFDEVAPDLIDYVEKGINELNDIYNKNIFLVTSRPLENLKSWYNFSIANIMHLSLEKALALLDKINYDHNIKEKFISDLKYSLFEKHKSFLENPLLLSIMLLTYGHYADIPNKITIFYQYAFETLFYKHDATKFGFRRTRYSNLDIIDFQNVVSAFSFISYINNDISISEEKIREYLSNAKKIVSTQDFNEGLLFNDLLYSICLIVPDGLTFKFTHRSFQEYFTAKYISKCKKTDRMKILETFYPRSLTDNVFNLLFEIDKTILEEDFFFDKINQIISTLNCCDNREYQFFKKIVSYVEFSKQNIISPHRFFSFNTFADNFTFEYKFEHNSEYIIFMIFKKLYNKHFTQKQSSFENDELLDKDKKIKYFLREHHGDIYSSDSGSTLKLSLEYLQTHETIYEYLKEKMKEDLFFIRMMFELPKNINKENSDKNINLNELLSIRNIDAI